MEPLSDYTIHDGGAVAPPSHGGRGLGRWICAAAHLLLVPFVLFSIALVLALMPLLNALDRRHGR